MVLPPLTMGVRRNGLRLPGMEPLRVVQAVEYEDDVLRVEVLECGHKKTTFIYADRPARRRRCVQCAAPPAPLPSP